MSDVHPTARDGFQHGSHYDLHRPSYTDEIVKYTISRLLHTNNDGGDLSSHRSVGRVSVCAARTQSECNHCRVSSHPDTTA
ncbi:hypothetical protein DPMN_063000 [Dreissena polymorpha]|uniref:Uncharacterized protein n=1 Tax=Dreissena polymorpha TaxID=45954 RepID=A0A9D4HIN2_DREPO|nr:hypothetical protein DPMN_063000 [Dreissena polymorpha]